MNKTIEISEATRRNWNKLGSDFENKLKSRANKTRSDKRFVPVERCSGSEAISWVEDFVNYVVANKIDIKDALCLLIVDVFKCRGIGEQRNCKNFVKKYLPDELLKIPFCSSVIDNEFDILGTIYQSYMVEGDKNKKGAYYTPWFVVNDMVKDIELVDNDNFFDPCCGSGAFLMGVKTDKPWNIYGFDIDPIAVMLARANLIIKYAGVDFEPNVYEFDFLLDDLFYDGVIGNIGGFDYIVTNPPWGSTRGVLDGENERSSSFYIKALRYAKSGGCVSLLMPVSILNVRQHKSFRDYLVDNFRLEELRIFDKLFSGVTTKYVAVKSRKAPPKQQVTYVTERGSVDVDIKNFNLSTGNAFSMVSAIDRQIIDKIKRKGNNFLTNSDWALGIVTGNNREKLHTLCGDGEEKIYIGKNVKPYVLTPASYYIKYDRNDLQQVARDEMYRADEKLVYKFISKKLTFAYDNTGALFLNSANILIPKIKNMSVKTVMAFLNDEIFQYLYIKLFNEIKILKKNLLELPFPDISESDNEALSKLVDGVISGNLNNKTVISNWISDFYGLSLQERKRICEVVNGKAY